MGRIGFFGMAVCGVATLAMSAGANAQQDRVSATEKGSLLVYSKIELVWNSAGNVIGDTFLTITNDFPEDVHVQFYFINGDAPDGENPGWNYYDNAFDLTKDQTKAWNASTGGYLGSGDLSPFTVLDPDGRDDGFGNRILRGYAYGFAVNSANEEIRWNHLAGTGTLIRYDRGAAWEYNAWAFQAVTGANGDALGTPGTLSMDGAEYAPAFDQLLMTFQAVGSNAYSTPAYQVMSDTDITLHPATADLVREGLPVATKAEFNIWNENEVKFSGLYRCILCWDQTLASDYVVTGVPNHFLIGNLQTNFGKARIDGVAGAQCDSSFEGNAIVAEDTALLGLRATLLSINMGGSFAAAGVNMFGMGTQDASFTYEPLAAPPEAPAGADRNADPFGISGLLDGVRKDVRGFRTK